MSDSNVSSASGRTRWQRLRRSGLVLTYVAMLSGGSVMTSCETRLKGTLRTGTENYVYSLLNAFAQAGVEALTPTADDE